MEFEEINQRASRRENPPDSLTPAERISYLALSLLYELHGRGIYTRDEGIAMKKRLQQDYDQYIAQEREWLRCQTAMKILRRSDIPIVQGVVAEADRMFSEDQPNVGQENT